MLVGKHKASAGAQKLLELTASLGTYLSTEITVPLRIGGLSTSLLSDDQLKLSNTRLAGTTNLSEVSYIAGSELNWVENKRKSSPDPWTVGTIDKGRQQVPIAD